MAETKMQLVDWLDDLCVRFIINLPHEELTSVERICFQIEEAQWFYEDFIRAQDPTMPAMNLRRFCELIFQHCPLLAPFSASATLSYAEFLAYKTRVPVRGAILVNEDMTEVVLVKGWNKKAKWSFPRGKINKEEKDLDCAIREVYEETGFDVRGAGLVDENEDNAKAIDMSLREQQMRLYVFRGVPMDTVFEPKTRKEISKIQWYKISDLANTGKGKEGPIADGMKNSQFYMVAPFIKPLKSWIKHQRAADKQDRSREPETEPESFEPPKPIVYDDGMITTDAEDDGHFQRLLSGLHSHQPDVDITKANGPASTADLSAELKRMLSIGGPAIAQPQHRPNQDNPLLSLLRGDPRPQIQQAPHPLPQTPLDQIVNVQPEAQTPYHRQPRPPPYSEVAPPPAFPISQAPPHPAQSFPYEQNHAMHWQGDSSQIHFDSQHDQLPPHFHAQHAGHMPSFQTRGVLGFNVPAPPPPQISNPLQTGDPAFRSQFPQYNQAQQQLPTPKPPPQTLTNHALGLLNVFKSPNPPSVKPAAVQKKQPDSQLPEVAPQSNERKDHSLLASQSSSGDTYSQPKDGFHQPYTTPPSQIQKPKSLHQDSLLDLFRGAAPPKLRNTGLAPATTDLVELAAQPSPLMPREAVKPADNGLSMRRLSSIKSLSPQPEIRRTPSLASQLSGGIDNNSTARANMTSATVSGPLNAPDFETVKKTQPQKPVELGNGAMSPLPHPVAQISTSNQSAGYQAGASHGLMAGLRRAGATPPVPVHTVTNNTTMEAPRPFHPTSILRKSAQDIADMAQAQGGVSNQIQASHQATPGQHRHQVPLGLAPTQVQNTAASKSDRRKEAPQSQKDALLSLFGRASANVRLNNDQPPTASMNMYTTSYQGSLPTVLTTRGLATSNAHLTGDVPSSAGPGLGITSGITSPVSPIPGNIVTGKRGMMDPNMHSSGSAVGQSHSNAYMQSQYGTIETPRSSRISSIASMQGSLYSLPAPVQGNTPLQPQQGGNAFGPTSAPGYSISSFPGTPGGVSVTNLGLGGRPTPPTQGSTGSARGSISFPSAEAVNSGSATGTQSPITPVEKNFLMGYLQGVVKEGSRRGSGGGSAILR